MLCGIFNKYFISKKIKIIEHEYRDEYEDKDEDEDKSDYDTECWICYCVDKNIKIVCKCPNRKVHIKCLNKWKLINIGKEEQTHCRFCNSKYLSTE